MTDPTTFRPRKLPQTTGLAVPNAIESDIHTLLSSLRSNASNDIYTVLAGATNTYLDAVIRFTGNGKLAPADIDNLLTVWQIMLDVGRRGQDYTGGKAEVEAEQ